MAQHTPADRPRVAVITGAGSGIGAALARAARERGSDVVVADIDEASAREVAQLIGAAHMACDVADPEQVQRLAEFTLARFGHVDDLFNNAGVGSAGPIDRMTPDDWRWMLGVNLNGVIHGVSSFLPLLRRSSVGGRLVNICSMSAVSPLPGLGAYATAKAGVLALSEVLAAELAGGPGEVSVSAVLAGPVRTNINVGARRRGPTGTYALADADLTGPIVEHMIEPDEAARRIFAGVDAGRLYIATHPALAHRPRERFDAILEAFAADSDPAPHDRPTS